MKNIINFEDFWPEENRDFIAPDEFIGQSRSDLISEIVRLRELVANQRSEVERVVEKSEIISQKGLWFKFGHHMSTLIPETGSYNISYDGHDVALFTPPQWVDINPGKPYLFKFTEHCNPVRSRYNLTYNIYRRLTMKDFEVVRNPSFRFDDEL